MKPYIFLLPSALILGSAFSAHAQRVPTPRAAPDTSARDTTVMSAADSLRAVRRTTAAPSPFHECIGSAFQSCASGETSARLSLDGTAFGVLFTRQYDGKTNFMPRIARGAGGGGGGGGGGAGGAGGRSGGGRGGKKRG